MLIEVNKSYSYTIAPRERQGIIYLKRRAWITSLLSIASLSVKLKRKIVAITLVTRNGQKTALVQGYNMRVREIVLVQSKLIVIVHLAQLQHFSNLACATEEAAAV